MNIIDFIKNVFAGNWKAAWQNVKNIFSNIISGIGNIFKLPINFIIDGMNAFIKGLNKLKIPDWVPGVGGKGLNIPLIKKLRVGMESANLYIHPQKQEHHPCSHAYSSCHQSPYIEMNNYCQA